MPRRPKTPTVSFKAVGERLRALREEKRLTQADLARTLGTHQTNVSEMERGIRGITVHQLVKLSRALKVTPNEILGEGMSTGGAPAKVPARFVRRLEKIGALPKAEQDALLTIMDRMLETSGDARQRT